MCLNLNADPNRLVPYPNTGKVENHIQYAGRCYSGGARSLNTRIDLFPDLSLVEVSGYCCAEYFAHKE